MAAQTPFDPETVYFIAEAGVNHNGSIERAKEMIDVAADSGADAVKFQAYVAEASVRSGEGKVDYQDENTDEDESQLDMLRRYELSKEDHVELRSYCNRRDVDFLTTVSTMESIDKIRGLDLPFLKIGSSDLNNHPAIEYVLELEIPLIISTGMAYMDEIIETQELIESTRPDLDIAFLHCISDYPTDPNELNLAAIRAMREELSTEVGFSDHTVRPEIPSVAVGAGATIIEKHFTLNRNLPGPDHEASLEPHELDKAVSLVRLAEQSLGDGKKRPSKSEIENRPKFRRSIHATTHLEKGDIIDESNIRVCRPAEGLDPKHWERVIGTELRRSIAAGDPLSEKHIGW